MPTRATKLYAPPSQQGSAVLPFNVRIHLSDAGEIWRPRALFLSWVVAFATSLVSCMHQGNRAADPGRDDGLTLIQQSEMLDTLVREPMVIQHPNGAVFVTGYNRTRPRLWKSADLGATWSEVNVGMPRDGAVGNSDVDLAVAPDGTLYFVQLTYDPRANEGVQLAVGVSRDTGSRWRWSIVSRARYDDRPWIDVTPNGTAHLIWNDGTGVLYTASRDRGVTWAPPSHIHDRGGSSHLAVGPHGEIAVHIIPGARSGFVCDEGTDLIALSTDDGATWRKFPAAGNARPSGCLGRAQETPRWVDPLAFDRTGALFSLWTDSAGVWLSRAQGDMKTWTTWRVSSRDSGAATPFFPYLASRATGELAATWVLDTKDTMHWQAAHVVLHGDDGSRTVDVANPLILESWRDNRPEAGGEYLAVAFLVDGSIAVVSPIQNAASKRLGFAWRRFAVHR
jgi:hypothetical protein